MPEIYQSVVFGMGFWIDSQGLFMSAPSYATGGGCDMDNAIPVYDWENWGELTEHHHSHLQARFTALCVERQRVVPLIEASRKYHFAQMRNSSGEDPPEILVEQKVKHLI